MKKQFEKTLKKLKGEESVVVECSTYDESVLFCAEYNSRFDKSNDWMPSYGNRPIDLRFNRYGYIGFNFHDESDYRSDNEFYEIVAFFNAAELVGETALDDQDIDIAIIM